MVENSKIEWTDHTHNEWIGCAKVSPGCQHCYAETLMDTRYGRVKWGVNGTRVLTSEANRKKPFAWDRAAKKAGVRHRVFCSSLSDVFEDREELIPWRRDLFETILDTPNLDWLLLTKRPDKAREYLETMEGVLDMMHPAPEEWPLPNVWIGTSVEDQKRADERIPELLKIPAAVRFLSMEPLLGPVDLQRIPLPGTNFAGGADVLRGGAWTDGPLGFVGSSNMPTIDWVIVGGESGPGARPMHPWWAKYIRDQCHVAGVPFFFKQWGEWAPGSLCGKEHVFFCDSLDHEQDADESGECPECEFMAKVGKSKAGRLLDGREWSEFPNLQRTGG